MPDYSPYIALALKEAPAIIAAFKAMFAKQNPGVPTPTSEEVIAAFNHAFAASLAKDDDWLASHPE